MSENYAKLQDVEHEIKKSKSEFKNSVIRASASGKMEEEVDNLVDALEQEAQTDIFTRKPKHRTGGRRYECVCVKLQIHMIKLV